MSKAASIGFALGRFVERVVTIAVMALAGGAVGAFLGQSAEFAAIGAAAGAGLGLVIGIARAARRKAAAHGKAGRIGTIVAITAEAPPGAPQYHHTYVLIDDQGKRRKFKLTPEQARTFSQRFAVGDVGRFTAAGSNLASFDTVSPTAPVRPNTGVRVFISYAHGADRDGQMAQYASEVFAASGLEPWFDRTQVKPGTRLRDELVQRVEEAHFFVPLLSPAYLVSEWCLKEFEVAAEAGIPMRPIKITAGTLVPPPYLKSLYETRAGDPVYLDLTSREAPRRLREMAEEMAGSASRA